jgi:ferrous iron transport protein B
LTAQIPNLYDRLTLQPALALAPTRLIDNCAAIVLFHIKKGYKFMGGLTLTALMPGEGGAILALHESEPLKTRLLELGFTPQTHIRMIRNDGGRAALAIEMRGMRFALGVEQAKNIEITRQSFPEKSPAFSAQPIPLFSAPRQEQPISPNHPRRIALVGHPNSGKSTLFTALTHVWVPVGNYPGVTIETHEEPLLLPNHNETLLCDLPGCYSLIPLSLEENITTRFLTQTETPVSVLVCVVDVTRLAHSLYLLLQLKALPQPIVVALNMVDRISPLALQHAQTWLQNHLQLPCVAVSARKQHGMHALCEQLCKILDEAAPPAQPAPPPTKALPLFTADEIAQAYQEIDVIMANVPALSTQSSSWDMSFDRFFLHPRLGKLGIVVTLFCLLQMVIQLGAPLGSIIENLLSQTTFWVNQVLGTGILQSLFLYGFLAGIGNLLTFVPQIGLLFVGIALLEESGLMTRMVFLLDHWLRNIGLGGRSIIPLLSSCGCAVPGIMATRMITHPQERLRAIFVSPFISCSARLPTYILVTSALFSHLKPFLGIFSMSGIMIFFLYLLGLFSAFIMSFFLSRSVFPAEKPMLCFELPHYRLPHWRSVGVRAWQRCRDFIQDTGFTMVTLSLVLWLLLSFPLKPAAFEQSTASGDASYAYQPIPIEESYAGQLGRWIEPVMRPLGFDWRITIGLVASFAAREVMVTTLTQVYSLEQGDRAAISLRKTLEQEAETANNAAEDNHFTPLVAVSLLVFFALALQCSSTVVVVARETQSWRFPAIQLLVMNAIAYISSFLVYQGGRCFGWR